MNLESQILFFFSGLGVFNGALLSAYWRQTVAPTGLSFYTGNEFPQWKDNLIIPGLSRGSLWRIALDGQTVKSVEELFVDDRVRSRKVVQSPAGKLYMLTDEDDGKILRIRNGEK